MRLEGPTPRRGRAARRPGPGAGASPRLLLQLNGQTDLRLVETPSGALARRPGPDQGTVPQSAAAASDGSPRWGAHSAATEPAGSASGPGGALGLLVGIGVPLIGIAASVALVLYFAGAIVAVIRAHWYSQIRYPAPYLVLAAGSLMLRLASF
jgi:DoxX-like family